MKIICISDTHNQHQFLTDELIDLYKLYPDAILIHSGDACLAGTKKEAIDFLEWFGNLPFESKIFIPGNHDIAFDKAFSYIDYVELQEFAENKSINLLINDVYNIKTLKIVACSLIPFLSSWAFFADDSQRERFFEYIDQDADLIISHSPPYGCGDRASRGFGKFEHTGCKYLRNYIDRNNTPIVINGHIHEDFGDISHGIQATRDSFASCWFDAVNCKEGIVHLESYKKQWSNSGQCFTDQPKHDIHSEGADSFRQFAQGYKEQTTEHVEIKFAGW